VITIVATNDIKVSGSLTPANSSSYIALIGTKNMSIEGAAATVEGIFYCHNPAISSTMAVKGVTTVTGSIAADNVTTDHSVTLNPDPRLNLRTMRQMRLPGL
jgi:hypothetical protein